MTRALTPKPQISPLHPTLQAGQALAFEALGMTDVDWTLEHSPLDGGLLLTATQGLHTSIRVPHGVEAGGIYFLRATNRRDPRQTAFTTLRVSAAAESAVPYRRHLGVPSAIRPASPRAVAHRQPGFLSELRGFLGLRPATA